MLRRLFDEIKPNFEKGGKLEKLYPLYEAQDTFLFSPGDTATGRTHVRDAIDTKRMMSTVILALIPCIFMALYNTGYQSNRVIEASGIEDIDRSLIANWRYGVMHLVGATYSEAGGFYSNFGNPYLMYSCLVHGFLYFFPIYLVTMIVGGTCELVFSILRGHEINEGFLVTGMLYPLTLPPTLPLWQVGLGIAFGVVIGKEIFGGTGTNFLNPALTARAFVFFSFGGRMTGTEVWVAGAGKSITDFDGYSGPTPLGALAGSGAGGDTASILADSDVMKGVVNENTIDVTVSWWDAFWGNMQGSMGETSAFACLIGAAILIISRIGSWQIMSAVVISMSAFSGLLCLWPGSEIPALFRVDPTWHFVLGSFAFGTVFMATDPVSAAMTTRGKWIYGFLIGFMIVLVRVVNGAFAEGVMLAILFANVMAPLIDWLVIDANIRWRKKRDAAR
jgi:Na+-transporting NADH:ubiquinone oxidoreductase subunit B